VTQRYSARRDGRDFGPYAPGETVELDTDDAEWVNRDAPGTLVDHVDPEPEPEPEPQTKDDKPEAKKATKANRMHTGGPKREW
jgi:hypothetical protein